MHADLLITDITELATPTGTGACRGHAMDAVDVIEDAVIAITGDRITWVGERVDWTGTADNEIDCRGGAVIPALVDPHTHAVWRGDRLEDFEARSRGTSYEEILARGGGIWNTIFETNDEPLSSEDPTNLIADLAEERLAFLIGTGAATIEIKSGYGFTHQGEIRLLEAIRMVGERSPATIVPTLLIHVPPRDKSKHEEYVAMVTDDLIPEVARRQLATAIDVFIEEHAFSVEQARRIFRAATDRRRERYDDPVHVRFAEDDEADQFLVRIGVRRWQHSVPGGTPPVAGPPGEQVGDVDRECAWNVRRVRPLAVEGLHLEPAVARLPVEDGQDSPVGVRCDPELPLERRTGD
jgi:imidazolonepropionase-like amidohydrolase